MAKPLKFISTFSGAGGLDLGLEMAGLHCVYASDIDAKAVETLKANQRARTDFMHGGVIERIDIRQNTGAQILAQIGLSKGDVPILAGGPPCQSWSSAGSQKGFDDPRGQLFADHIRIAKELDVRWLVFENVRGLVTARGPDGKPGSALETIRKTMLRNGFQSSVFLLNAADFGVAQRRVRMVMIGYRTGDAPYLPIQTHSREGGRFLPWVTLGDTLASIPALKPHEIILPSLSLGSQLASVIPGSGVKSMGRAEPTRPGGHWGYKQGAFVADLMKPARTVTAGSAQDWIKDPVYGLRRLSPRECAAVQSFPNDWIFCGSSLDQYRQAGNAVAPLFGKAVGLALIKTVKRKGSSLVASTKKLAPLAPELVGAQDYTAREEARNGSARARSQTTCTSRAVAA